MARIPKIKKPRRARRAYRRARAVPRALRGALRQVHHFTRWCDLTTHTVTVPAISADVFLGKAYHFQLDQLPDYSDFTTLYDAYTITGVKLVWNFAGNTAPIYDTYFANMPPECLFAIDYDDADAPTSDVAGWKSLQQMRSRFITIGNKATCRYKMFVRPRILGMAYETAVTTAYVPLKARTYIDMSNVDVPHYGVKMVLRIPHIADSHEVTVRVNVSAKFYVTCKHPR